MAKRRCGVCGSIRLLRFIAAGAIHVEVFQSILSRHAWLIVGKSSSDFLEGRAMTHDLQRVLESKRALRRMLASRPVSEKLRMLDALRGPLRTIRKTAERRRSLPVRTD
jgi:hypothetical protein